MDTCIYVSHSFNDLMIHTEAPNQEIQFQEQFTKNLSIFLQCFTNANMIYRKIL